MRSDGGRPLDLNACTHTDRRTHADGHTHAHSTWRRVLSSQLWDWTQAKLITNRAPPSPAPAIALSLFSLVFPYLLLTGYTLSLQEEPLASTTMSSVMDKAGLSHTHVSWFQWNLRECWCCNTAGCPCLPKAQMDAECKNIDGYLFWWMNRWILQHSSSTLCKSVL